MSAGDDAPPAGSPPSDAPVRPLKLLTDHPERYATTNELHARPFQPVEIPGRILSLALMPLENAAERDAARDRAHLTAFLDRHGAPHPAPEANHYEHDFDRFRMKWERHTEFVSYTLYERGETQDLFEGALIGLLPPDWLAEAPGQVIAAVQLEILTAADGEGALECLRGPLRREFNAESLAVARVLDGAALALGDFRIHEGGFSRFALVVYGEAGARRIGRLVQRLLEIETYRAGAMLALPVARKTARRLNEIERDMAHLITLVADDQAASESAILSELTELSADLEAIAAATAFRFGASNAYQALVHQRIQSLREERVQGRQLFAEFMNRRFVPAMRTCQAAERRLDQLSVRAGRIAELLRTRVNVAVEAQNQQLLASMDRRADLQLRLQETVEGLSVVAISYYAVSLAGYVVAPAATGLGLSKDLATAAVAVPIVLAVWAFVRRLRRRVTGR
ncbi:MAG: DUF3422 family protein [Paracoccaceae bacterium]